MRWLFRLAMLAGIGYAVFGMLACTLQRSMIYFPEKDTLENLLPRARATGFKPWKNAKGEIIGWVTGNEDFRSPVLILHGNAGNALHRNALAARILAADPGATVGILEYPGFGARSGSPSQKSLVAAAKQAVDALPPGAGRPVIVGESLGTGVSAALASYAGDRLAGLILLTPFDSLVSVAASHYAWLPVGILLVDRFDSRRALRDLNLPVVFVVAGEDTVTPTRLGQLLAETYAGPKILRTLEGAGHNDPVNLLETADWQQFLRFARGTRSETMRD